jgi:hypothetical protein
MAQIKNDRKLTLKRLKEALSYNPSTGLFIWKITASPKAVANSVAGTIIKSGYRMIVIDGEHYKASRLAWFYTFGEWPERLIDHENGTKSDDRIVNLRPAVFAENSWNMGITKRNTSGFKGVCRTKWGWQASIGCEGRQHYLGSFRSAAEAAEAYKSAAQKLHGQFARFS